MGDLEVTFSIRFISTCQIFFLIFKNASTWFLYSKVIKHTKWKINKLITSFTIQKDVLEINLFWVHKNAVGKDQVHVYQLMMDIVTKTDNVELICFNTSKTGWTWSLWNQNILQTYDNFNGHKFLLLGTFFDSLNLWQPPNPPKSSIFFLKNHCHFWYTCQLQYIDLASRIMYLN